ncbi:hypothetical protein SAMN05421503_1492 [Terribacillus aidingensis]|uniref:Uncharacterized protein n=1 Tax=Terribacillus aidingensis TaxID=586416 RepID=A0A285NM49_9BACI|nr:hypothetical protein [Terribacillus aidingensis]SNZ10037.1 hypothetical protein SAMN05421503_1492 [Terribacillus aidingensis]
MILINLLDGQSIEVTNETVLVGIDNAPRENNEEFYLSIKYVGTLEGDTNGSPSALNTGDHLGITGFILSHDAFALGEGKNETIYLRSAVKSISVV